MPDKTPLERCDDTLAYIHQSVSSRLALHLRQVIATASEREVDKFTKTDLGAEVSLSGARSWWYATDANKRKALRALLLCQHVYFSKVWNRVTVMVESEESRDKVVPALINIDSRPEGMRETSLEHWRTRSENDIIQAIRLFTTTDNADALALADAAGHPGDKSAALPDLKLTRDTRPFPGHGTCYSAVIYWLFKAGLVSYPWMMRHKGAQPPDLPGIFGVGTLRWAADRPFTRTSTLPTIPRGHIVHMYDRLTGAGGYAGHWLVSDGDGTGFGCNNDTDCDIGKQRNYDRCNLDKQFLAYKGTIELQAVTMAGRGTVEPKEKTRAQEGLVESFDPMAMPDRY